MARICLIGQSGTGKSWAAGAILERVLDPGHPNNPGSSFDLAVHFDPEDEETGLTDRNHDPLYQRLDVDVDLARRLNWKKVIYNHRKLRVVPDMREDEKRELYGAICGAVFSLCKDVAPEWTAFISCDEAGQYVRQHDADDRVLTVQTRGRKHGVETMHICQRPQQLHTTVISQSDRRFYFRVNDDNDLGKINKQAGFNVHRVPELDGYGLDDLEDRQVVVENKSSGEYVVQSTEDWTRIRPHHAKDDGIADGALPV